MLILSVLLSSIVVAFLGVLLLFFSVTVFIILPSLTMPSSSFSSPSIFASSSASRPSEDGNVAVLGARASYALQHRLVYPSHSEDLGSPRGGYMMIFTSSFSADFRFRILCLMMDYCELVQLAPGQLELCM